MTRLFALLIITFVIINNAINLFVWGQANVAYQRAGLRALPFGTLPRKETTAGFLDLPANLSVSCAIRARLSDVYERTIFDLI